MILKLTSIDSLLSKKSTNSFFLFMIAKNNNDK